jgi:hypothetical protein
MLTNIGLMQIRDFSLNYAFKIFISLMINIIVSENFLQASDVIEISKTTPYEALGLEIRQVFHFNDKLIKEKSKKYVALSSFDSLAHQKNFSQLSLENCYLYTMRMICTIKPDDDVFQAATSGIFDCVGVSIRSEDGNFFVSHMERRGSVISFKTILQEWIVKQNGKLEIHLVTLFDSPFLLEVVNLFNELDLKISSLTRTPLASIDQSSTDQQYIIFEDHTEKPLERAETQSSSKEIPSESPSESVLNIGLADSAGAPGSVKKAKKMEWHYYFPISYHKEAQADFDLFEAKYLKQGVSLYVDAKTGFVSFEIYNSHVEWRFNSCGSDEVPEEEKESFEIINKCNRNHNLIIDDLFKTGQSDYVLINKYYY